MARRRKPSGAIDHLAPARQAIARYWLHGNVPVFAILHTDCTWGREAAVALAANPLVDPEQQALLRRQLAGGVVPLQVAMQVLGAYRSAVNLQ